MLCPVAAVKSLPVHHHSSGYVLFPLGSLSPSWLFCKSNTTLANARMRMNPRKLQCCIWRDSIKPSLRFSWFCVFFVSEGNLFFTFILVYCSLLLCRVAAVKEVSPYIIIVQVMFYFLWDHWAHPCYFENQIPHKPALGGVCSLINYIVAYK